jgi:Secreted repeat of unknown function
VTFAGHPLYRFRLDKHAGEVEGQAEDFFGGRWYAVSSTGRAVTKVASGSTATTTTTTEPTMTYCSYGC